MGQAWEDAVIFVVIQRLVAVAATGHPAGIDHIQSG
jgi:hypothetical protein